MCRKVKVKNRGKGRNCCSTTPSSSKTREKKGIYVKKDLLSLLSGGEKTEGKEVEGQ